MSLSKECGISLFYLSRKQYKFPTSQTSIKMIFIRAWIISRRLKTPPLAWVLMKHVPFDFILCQHLSMFSSIMPFELVIVTKPSHSFHFSNFFLLRCISFPKEREYCFEGQKIFLQRWLMITKERRIRTSLCFGERVRAQQQMLQHYNPKYFVGKKEIERNLWFKIARLE